MGKYILKVDNVKISEQRAIHLIAGTNVTLTAVETEGDHEAAPLLGRHLGQAEDTAIEQVERYHREGDEEQGRIDALEWRPVRRAHVDANAKRLGESQCDLRERQAVGLERY